MGTSGVKLRGGETVNAKSDNTCKSRKVINNVKKGFFKNFFRHKNKNYIQNIKLIYKILLFI